MKKWILIIFLLAAAFIGILIKVYFNAVEPVKAAEKKAVALAKEQIHLKEVNDFQIYHGLETVDVIQGKNNDGEKIIVWISEKSKSIIVKKAKNGLSKQEAINKLLKEQNPKKIIAVRLGMEKNHPLWEIYYRSNNNLINYYYVDFETGKWLKKIENL